MERQDKVSSLMTSLWEILINLTALFYGQKQSWNRDVSYIEAAVYITMFYAYD